jgi:hypothetical protein
MRTRQILKRVAKLEDLICPRSDGNTSITLEELCRSMWRSDKKHFIEIAKNNSYQLFVYQFEQEDANAAALKGRRLGASS